jgi:hypothetical protein
VPLRHPGEHVTAALVGVLGSHGGDQVERFQALARRKVKGAADAHPANMGYYPWQYPEDRYGAVALAVRGFGR